MECMELGLDDSPECARIFCDCDSDLAALPDWMYSDLISPPPFGEAGRHQQQLQQGAPGVQAVPPSPSGSSQFDSASLSPRSDCSSGHFSSFCSGQLNPPASPLAPAATQSAGQSPARSSSSGEEERADDDDAAAREKKPIRMPQSKCGRII